MAFEAFTMMGPRPISCYMDESVKISRQAFHTVAIPPSAILLTMEYPGI
ncbi:MAG: hypothetical protein ACO3N7_05240 [Kiritimatiellia bacterium]